jgi:glucokinase
MILAGDIGGTKTNLALYELNGGKLKLILEKQFKSNNYSNLIDVLEEFKTSFSMIDIKAACFGIAGPVINDNCIATNLPWSVSKIELQKYLNIEKISLINDLEATAYGMLYLEDDQFVNINPNGKQNKGNHAVIAAGTGLGEAQLYFDKNQYHPIGCEGGHTDFAPLDEQQDNLLKWLRTRYNEHVSYERILSGPGIYTLYQFLKENNFAKESLKMKNIPKDTDKSAFITQCALEDNDPLSLETLNLFVKIYGAEAGNLALKSMSLGGVYIGGGIAPKILPILQNGYFMDNFIAKGRFKGMLQNMEVKVSLNQKTALLGAAYFSVDKLL